MGREVTAMVDFIAFALESKETFYNHLFTFNTDLAKQISFTIKFQLMIFSYYFL